MKLNYKVKPRIIMYKINEEKSCFLAQFFVRHCFFRHYPKNCVSSKLRVELFKV